MIDKECKISIYEENGKEQIPPKRTLKIQSHWNVRDFVVISFNEENKITVDSKDLEDAIKSCRKF